MSISYNLSDFFDNATQIANIPSFFDAILRGFTMQTAQAVDQNVNGEMWNKLFRYDFSSIYDKPIMLNIVYSVQ